MKFTKTMKRIFVSLFSALFCVTLALCLSVSSLFTASAAETVATKTKMYTDGASIRLNADGLNGIRFHVRVESNANREAVLQDKTYSEEEFRGLTTGILLIPSNKLSSGEELTLDGATNKYASGAKAANVTGEECVWGFRQSGDSYYYEATAYIYNIRENSYENKFTFRGYYKVGETVYYSDVDERSVSYVALQAKDDYTGDYKKELNGFLPEDLVNTDKFVNQGKYLYRLGNLNNVTLGSLFDLSDLNAYIGNDIAKFGESADNFVTCETVEGTVTCAFTPKTKLVESTLKFEGTGTVKLSIPDFAKYTRASTAEGNQSGRLDMHFEVIDAVNATTATSAETSNVVLLNDVGFSLLNVRNGWTLYGNGFKMTATKDVAYNTLGVGFVTIGGVKSESEKYPGGTLDNVQIICPNPSYQILYQSNMKDAGNSHTQTDSTSDARGNVRSAVLIDTEKADTVKIINSYISGGRAAIYARSGDLQVIGSTVDGGALANIYVGSGSSLLLRDATLIQEPKQATVYDTSKTLMGLSVLMASDNNGAPSITLEGEFTQYAWAHKGYKSYVPSEATSVVDTVLDKTDYVHSITYPDGQTENSVNLGIAFINTGGNASEPTTITDNRKSKNTVPYSLTNVTIGWYDAYVFSYTNAKGTVDTFNKRPTHVPAQSQETVLPTVEYTAMKENGIVCTSGYTVEDGWNVKLAFDLDTLGNFDFDFADIVAMKDNRSLSYTVEDAVGNHVDPSKWVTLNDTGIKKYVLLISDYAYDTEGKQLTEKAVVYKYTLILVSTKSSINPPTMVNNPNGDALLVVKSKGGDWTCAIPALEGAQINYYNKKSKAYETLNLSSLTPTNEKGKVNGTNNYWQYSDANGNFTLKVTCGPIHEGKSIYGMPVVVDNGGNKLYFTLSNTDGYVSTGTSARAVTLTYDFTANGQTLTFTKKWDVKYADLKDVAQYKYSDFINGTLTDTLQESSGGGSCVTADTLITLADGSQVRVDALTGNEQLLVWNMETGMLDSAPIMFLDSELETEVEIIHLYFSDGTDVKVISEHGFWDYDLNRYVYLDNTAAEYIGHTFAKQGGDSLTKVQLVDVVLEYEVATAWSPVTVGHLCYFVNGMLSMPGGVGGLFNIFEVDTETMTYDYEAIARDIELYGLFTYEELNAIVELPESMFYEAGGAYLKISIAKGNMTMDELIAMITRYTHFFI